MTATVFSPLCRFAIVTYPGIRQWDPSPLATTMGLKKKDLKALPGPLVETASEGVNLEVLGIPKRALELHVPYLAAALSAAPL